MSSHSARSRRPRHHLAHFPPQHYADLTASDMRLLAPIFRDSPGIVKTSALAAYETDVCHRISALPSHLRCVYPKLNSTFCTTHKKLNPLLIDSILHFIQDTVSPEALKRRGYSDKNIRILCDMSVTWGKKNSSEYFSHFDIKYGRISANFVDHEKDECRACKLARIADNDEGTLTNLGGLIISLISRKNWKVSKRVMWMEEWYRAVVDDDYNEPRSLAVKPMWDVAIELYRYHSETRHSEGRSYIDQHVKAAGQTDRVRDQASYATPQSGSAALSYRETLPSPHPFEDEQVTTTPPPSRFLQTPQAPRHASSIYSQMENWEQYREAETSPSMSYESRRQSRRPRQSSRAPIPSSIYSRGEDLGDEVDEWNYPGTVASQIIDSYRQREQ